MTDCQCSEPGWCERHGMHKPEGWWKLCQTHDDYFRAWEGGWGPGQVEPDPNAPPARRERPPGPGSILRKMLGCGHRRWQHYSDMDFEGSRCDVDKYSAKLSEYGKLGIVEATRLVRMVVETYERT